MGSLLRMLVRYHAGEKTVWSVVRVPTLEEEDRRQLHRELMTLKQNRTRVTNRIKGLLAGQGLPSLVDAHFPDRLAYMHRWDGGALLPGLRQRLGREYEQVALYTERIRQLEKERQRLLSTGLDAGSRQARQLYSLRGIGENGAWTLAMELFSWRKFHNRRELGAITGLVPTPYQSGETSCEQGIAKSGNRRVRALAIELAWGWLRYQPESQLTSWYEERFAAGAAEQLRRPQALPHLEQHVGPATEHDRAEELLKLLALDDGRIFPDPRLDGVPNVNFC